MRVVIYILSFWIGSTTIVISQTNCNVYKFRGDDTCYVACKIAIDADEFEEGSPASQILLSRSIDQCNQMDYAYYKKAMPYLKTGDFVEWKKLIDKAVKINPAVYLGYRAWCRFDFLRDYDGAVTDINKLAKLTRGDVGFTASGVYHLMVLKALCFKEKGETEKAILLMESTLNQSNYVPGYYDYLHLGVMYLEAQNFKEAEKALEKQIEHNDYIAESYFFLALAKQGLDKPYESVNLLNMAMEKYNKGERRFARYNTPIDKIYLSDIENELAKVGSLSHKINVPKR